MVKDRITLALSRARYAAMGAAIGAALGGLISRNAASSGAAMGALAGAFVGERRLTAQSKLDALKARREAGLGDFLPTRSSETDVASRSD